MDNITLKIKKRAFPSHGRVRIHESRLTDLKIVNGDHIDLINETAKKTVTVTVISDTMVGKDEVRVSEEDLKSLGLKEGRRMYRSKSPSDSRKRHQKLPAMYQQGLRKSGGM